MNKQVQKALSPGALRFYRDISLVMWLAYFVQKMSNVGEGLSTIPFNALLEQPRDKGGFGMNADAAGAVMLTIYVGWFVKALFGPITDNVSIFGMRRKPWLLFSLAMTAMGWLYVAFLWDGGEDKLITALTITIIFIAFSDVIVDGLMLMYAKIAERDHGVPKDQGNGPIQAVQWSGAFWALTLSALFGGVIAQASNFKVAAVVSAIFPAVFFFIVLFKVKEEKTPGNWRRSVKGVAAIFLIVVVAKAILTLKGLPRDNTLLQWEFLITPAIIVGSMLLMVRLPRQLVIPAVFIAIYFLNPFDPTTLTGQYYFTSHNQEFVKNMNAPGPFTDGVKSVLLFFKLASAEDIKNAGIAKLFFGSVFSTFALASMIPGAFIYKRYFATTPFYKVFMLCVLAQVGMAVLYAAFPVFGITSPVYQLVCAFSYGVIGPCTLLSLLNYVGSHSNKVAGQEASVYAFLVSLANIGVTLGPKKLGGWVYNTGLGAVKYVAGIDPKTGKNLIRFANPDPHGGFQLLIVASLAYLLIMLFVVRYFTRAGYLSGSGEE